MNDLQELIKNAIEQVEVLPDSEDFSTSKANKWLIVNQRTWALKWLKKALEKAKEKE